MVSNPSTTVHKPGIPINTINTHMGTSTLLLLVLLHVLNTDIWLACALSLFCLLCVLVASLFIVFYSWSVYFFPTTSLLTPDNKYKDSLSVV